MKDRTVMLIVRTRVIAQEPIFPTITYFSFSLIFYENYVDRKTVLPEKL